MKSSVSSLADASFGGRAVDLPELNDGSMRVSDAVSRAIYRIMTRSGT